MFWDSELSGFGVRVYPSGSKFYVVQTRAFGQPAKRVTVGRHGIISPREARRRAALIILRIKFGEEPAPERIGGPSVAEENRQPAIDELPARAIGQAHERGPHPEPGETPAMADQVLDHSEVEPPSRDSLRKSAERISDSIAGDILKDWVERSA